MLSEIILKYENKTCIYPNLSDCESYGVHLIPMHRRLHTVHKMIVTFLC